MRTKFLLLVCLLVLPFVAQADDDKPIQVNQLPAKAQQFIKQHFSEKSIALAKEESDFFEKSFNVIFTDGTKLEFDRKGNWEKVSCRQHSVPQAIVPETIRTYVSTHYPQTRIVKVEREKSVLEVKLSNGTELKFNSRQELIKIDQ